MLVAHSGKSGDVPDITDSHISQLNERQQLDYRNYRDQPFTWFLTFGGAPDTAEGYADSTIAKSAHRIDSFVWARRGYTTDVTHDDADAYIRELAQIQFSEWGLGGVTDETDPDLDRLYSEHATVVDVLEDETGVITGGRPR